MDGRGIRRAVEALASDQDGVVSREQARALGADRWLVGHEVERGRWVALGARTIAVHGGTPGERGLLTASVWEAGANAVLDGVSSLTWAGLQNFSDKPHIITPWPNKGHAWNGSVVHRSRLWNERDFVQAGPVRRTRNDVAAIRAAIWARTDRAAATVMAMAVQQRITSGDRLLLEAKRLNRHRRRPFILTIAYDIADGAHSLGELDFGALCRARGLPTPTRQIVVRGPRGRVYLDVLFEAQNAVVEVEGIHHDAPENIIDDALRQNAVTIRDRSVLRVPVLGLRVMPDPFMDQVEALLLRRAA
ncbi:MAG TPA: hypothetical protein VLI04_20500 [Nocardioidaceae bacterium]|nr:hypothetical protein [Nocardioidaceae bacterium]